MKKIAIACMLGLVLASGCKVSEVTKPQSRINLPGEFATVEAPVAESVAQVSW